MRDDLVAIAILPSMMDAQLVKTNLISHGIDAFIENEHSASIAGGGEIRLFVHTNDSERAVDIIESMLDSQALHDAGYDDAEDYEEDYEDQERDDFEIENDEASSFEDAREKNKNRYRAEGENCPICSYPGFKTKGGKIREILAEILPFITMTKKCRNCGYERSIKEDDRFSS